MPTHPLGAPDPDVVRAAQSYRVGRHLGLDLLLARAFRRFLTDGAGDAILGRHLGDEPGRTDTYFVRVDPGYETILDPAEAVAVAEAIDRGRPQPVEEGGDDAVILVLSVAEARDLAAAADEAPARTPEAGAAVALIRRVLGMPGVTY